MADLLNVYQKCPQCNGVGEVVTSILPTEENPETETETIKCPMCNGTKEVYWGRMVEEESEE